MTDNAQSFTVGFLTCASWRVQHEVVLDVHAKAATRVSQIARDLGLALAAVDDVPTSEAELDAALTELKRARPHAIILHYAGWTEDETVLDIANALDCPLMLWVTDDVFVAGVSQLVAHVGYMEASVCLKKAGLGFSRFFGGPDARSDDALRAFAKAAKTAADLSRLRFGWIGPGCGAEGILDCCFDPAALEQKLGVEFVRIPLQDMFSRYRKTQLTGDDEQERRLEALGLNLQGLRRLATDDACAVDDSIRFALALDGLVAEHSLGALSLRCFPEFKVNNIPSPCLAISAMNQSGIPASCEGDVLSGLSMYVLSRLSGCPATIMDVFVRDEGYNTMELFHCGSAAAALADPETGIQYRTHCKPANHRAGVTVEFAIRSDRVSFLKFDTLADRLKLFLFQGETMAPARMLRGCQATVRTDTPVHSLIETLIDHGVSHHVVLSPGDVRREAECLADMAGLKLVCL